MEIVYFVSFVVVCAFVAMWAVGRSRGGRAKTRKVKGRAQGGSSREQLLHTPSDYKLSHPDQVWQSRRQSSTTGVSRTNSFVARSLGQDPEYDGYSRRDRHHVRDRNAKIREREIREQREAREREARAANVGYKRSKAGG
jgi:hypothetical protein